MMRRGAWKLNYYHGQEPQLFNLEEDPHEVWDRARDPACRDLLQDLQAQVLDSWDPEAIAAKMEALRAERPILSAWGRHVQPSDCYRWDLRPEMGYLDEPQDSLL